MEQAPLLETLAERHGQPGAMNWLAYFLSKPVFRAKKPYLVLLVKAGATLSPLHPDDVHAAVLLFEYRPLGLATRAFSTDDWGGFRTVIGPASERGDIAAMAARALFAHGAQVALISYGDPASSKSKLNPALHHGTRWALQSRHRLMTFPLASTFKETLAKFGKSTRFNFGYYRRRVTAVIPCEFIADARGLIDERELKALNAGCLNPISLSEFGVQYESCCTLPGGYLVGLRSLQGRWLSLIGGWRQADVTVLCWQLNTAGFEKLSLSTAMRSFFLEHEIGRGAKTLIIYGGTGHSMVHSFLREEVTDLLVERRSWRVAALHLLAGIFSSSLSPIPVHSLLVQTVVNPKLEWASGEVQNSAQKRELLSPKILEPDDPAGRP